MRRLWVTVSALLAVFLLAVVVIPCFIPWSPLNCWHEEVDITTGRIRRQWILLFVKVAESTEESPLSEVVLKGQPSTATPQWHRINTFSPGTHYSPHYLYHGAGHQIAVLADLWQAPPPHSFPTELKEPTARHLLALWQGGSYFRATDYLFELDRLLRSESRDTLIETIAGIEMPKLETVGDRTVKTTFFPSGMPMERFEGYLTAAGEFVADGVWESWYADGKREVYGHLSQGRHDGRRFEWSSDGSLIAIRGYHNNELTEYEGANLARHPDFEKAQELARSGSDAEPSMSQ